MGRDMYLCQFDFIYMYNPDVLIKVCRKIKGEFDLCHCLRNPNLKKFLFVIESLFARYAETLYSGDEKDNLILRLLPL